MKKLMSYEFEAIDKNVLKRYLNENVQNQYISNAICMIIDGVESKTARLSNRARWNRLDSIGMYECSACKLLYRNKTNYCQNCGAKMDLEEGEEND